MDIDQIVALLQAHAWVPIASIVIGLLVRLVKSDAAVAWFPVTIPPAVRSWLAIGLGIGAGVLDKVVAGGTWTSALLGGLAAAITAISGHELVIESLRGGRELGESKSTGGSGGDAAKIGGNVPSIKPNAPAGPYSAKLVRGPWSRAWFGAMAVVVCLTIGCGMLANVPQWIQEAIVVEQNIAAIISALRSAKDFVFAVSPPSESVRKTVEDAFQDVSLAEAAISELLNAGDSVTQEQLDAAYAHLKNAYSNLTKLLGQLGIVHEDASGLLRAKRGDGTVALVPLALKVRVVKR